MPRRNNRKKEPTTRYSKGRRSKHDDFKSDLERHTDKVLKSKHKLNYTYEKDELPVIIIQKYIPDFKVMLPNGKEFFIECKGYFDEAAKKKMLGVKLANPKLDIRFFFSKNNPVRKGAKMRYSDWCEKHGFPYCIGSLPNEWFR